MPPITPRTRAVWYIAVCAATLFAAASPAAAFELITPAEAALPAGKVPAFRERASPGHRPQIDIVSPSGAGAVYSPVEFKLSFKAHGGAAIDPNSVVVTYVKDPQIDITPRVKAFITADGINIAQADVPPGVHQFFIELKDTEGNPVSRELKFQVLQ